MAPNTRSALIGPNSAGDRSQVAYTEQEPFKNMPARRAKEVFFPSSPAPQGQQCDESLCRPARASRESRFTLSGQSDFTVIPIHQTVSSADICGSFLCRLHGNPDSPAEDTTAATWGLYPAGPGLAPTVDRDWFHRTSQVFKTWS